MIAAGEPVFVDTGAWIALAEIRDPLHPRAREQWAALAEVGARLVTSVPVIIETFTFLDRRASHEAALKWKASLDSVRGLRILGVTPGDMEKAWSFMNRREFHRLSLVDSFSFVLMDSHKIKTAFTFDTHFSIAGFRSVG